MKELEQITKDEVKEVKQVVINTEVDFIGSVKNLKKNHILYEINRDTLEINPAEFEQLAEIDYNAIGGIRNTKRVIVKENHFYSSAMNKKNALKKYQNYLVNGPKTA